MGELSSVNNNNNNNIGGSSGVDVVCYFWQQG